MMMVIDDADDDETMMMMMMMLPNLQEVRVPGMIDILGGNMRFHWRYPAIIEAAHENKD
jgi:hypothetical protein